MKPENWEMLAIVLIHYRASCTLSLSFRWPLPSEWTNERSVAYMNLAHRNAVDLIYTLFALSNQIVNSPWTFVARWNCIRFGATHIQIYGLFSTLESYFPYEMRSIFDFLNSPHSSCIFFLHIFFFWFLSVVRCFFSLLFLLCDLLKKPFTKRSCAAVCTAQIHTTKWARKLKNTSKNRTHDYQYRGLFFGFLVCWYCGIRLGIGSKANRIEIKTKIREKLEKQKQKRKKTTKRVSWNKNDDDFVLHSL